MSFKRSMDERTRGHGFAVKRQGLLSHEQPGWVSRSLHWAEERSSKVWLLLHDVLQKWRRTDPRCPGRVTVTGQPLCKQDNPASYQVVAAWRCVLKRHRTVHTHKHTKDSTKKSETQTRSVLSIVVPRAVSWVSRSIVTMEDPSLDEAAMVSGELSTLFLQLLVSLSDFKVKSLKIADIIRTSLVVQWLTLHAASAGTWVHSPVRSQLRVSTLQVKIPQAAVKTQHRQINN